MGHTSRMPMDCDGIRQSLRHLFADSVRTNLVILGVIWGILSLTVVLSFGRGFGIAIDRALNASGPDLLILWSGGTTRPFQGLPSGRWVGLQPEDADLVREGVREVVAASPEYTSAGEPVEYAGARTNARVHGVTEVYGRLRRLDPLPGGRFLNQRDDDERRRVAVLGLGIKDRIFGAQSAVGKKLTLWGTPFTVVGVIRPSTTFGYYEGPDPEKIFVPASVFKVFRGWRYCTYLVAGIRDSESDRAALEGMYRVLASKNSFDPQDRAALSSMNRAEQSRQIGAIAAGVRILMGIVGVLGLLVALVGVANVLFVMVEERRREIGIQVAVGARPGRILRGVIGEAFVIVMIGGLVGIAGSAVVLGVFNALPLGERPRGYLGEPTVSVTVAVTVTAVLCLAAMLAGCFPARRAAMISPIEALRKE